MRGKRRDPRYTLSVPWSASLRVPGDVTVQRVSGDDVWVLSVSPARVDEVLTLDLSGVGPEVRLRVRVVESKPVLVDGTIRHGLRLQIVSRLGGESERKATAAGE
jgi:hypothetical protein